jgi:magnesium chelatase family protein
MQSHEVIRGAASAVAATESSAAMRQRVCAAAERATARQGAPNSSLSVTAVGEHCALDTSGEGLLDKAAQRLALSPRAQHRVLRVARTIADLSGAERIAAAHLAEALSYRQAMS